MTTTQNQKQYQTARAAALKAATDAGLETTIAKDKAHWAAHFAVEGIPSRKDEHGIYAAAREAIDK